MQNSKISESSLVLTGGNYQKQDSFSTSNDCYGQNNYDRNSIFALWERIEHLFSESVKNFLIIDAKLANLRDRAEKSQNK